MAQLLRTLGDGITCRRAWLLVVFTGVAYFLNYTDRQVVFSIFPVLKSELGFTNAQLGLIGSIFLWVYGLCSPVAGQIGDRFSKRYLVCLSLILWSGVTVLTGLSNSPATMLACRGLMGITEALFVPPAVALIGIAHGSSTRSLALGLLFSAQLIGLVMGGWYGGFVAQEYNWRFAFYLLGLVGLVYAVPYGLFLKGVSEDTGPQSEKVKRSLPLFELFRVPTYLLLCLSFPVYTALLWLLYTWLPTFLYEKFGLSLAAAGFTATAYMQGTTLVGLVLGGAVADWLYKRTRAARGWLVCGGMLFSAPWVHFIGHSDRLFFVKMAALGFGFGSGVFISNLMACTLDIVPSHTRASSIGFINLVGTPASGLAVLLGGLLKESIGISDMMSYAALLSVGAGLMLALGIKVYFQQDYERAHRVGASPAGD